MIFLKISDITHNKPKEYMDIFYSEKLIAIDACTALTHKCNVLVIDENFDCFDKYGNKLQLDHKE